jgi:hypothetical protein
MKRLRPSVFASRTARLGAAGALLVCTACPGALEDPALFLSNDLAHDASSCPDIPTQVFLPACASAGCHSAASKDLGLDLESPDVASRLVGVRATGGGLLVDPAHPATSVVYTKLTPMPPYGARMPFESQPLDDATIACVLDWISQQRGGDAGSSSDGSSDGGSGADGSLVP